MHAERDIVMANPSVCLSVCPMPVLCLNGWTWRHTFWRLMRAVSGAAARRHTTCFCVVRIPARVSLLPASHSLSNKLEVALPQWHQQSLASLTSNQEAKVALRIMSSSPTFVLIPLSYCSDRNRNPCCIFQEWLKELKPNQRKSYTLQWCYLNTG